MSEPATPAAVGEPELHPHHHRHHSPAARRALLGAAGALYITGTIGSNVAPAWIDDHPVLVLMMSSRNRNLFASYPFIEPVPYAIVGFLRLFTVGIVLFHVGKWFGHRAIEWTEKQVGEMPTLYRWFERGLDRAGWVFVLLMPGSNLVCLMAGHRQMNVRRFLILLSVGLVIKLEVLWIGGRIFEDQIRSALDYIEKYQWWMVGGLFAVSFIQGGRKLRKNPPVALIEAEGDEDENDVDEPVMP